MATVLQLKQIIASLLGRTTVADLNPVNLTPAGINIDLGLVALNNARRTAERAHDFRNSETNAMLSISSTGSALAGAYTSGTLSVTGTLTPDASGTYSIIGVTQGLPFWSLSSLGTGNFYLSNNDGVQWNIGFGAIVNDGSLQLGVDSYWTLSTDSQNPAGAYNPNGSAIGVATVTATQAPVSVKRVKYVSLPLNGGDYEVIEFLTNDQFLSRYRMQTGRQYFNPARTNDTLGATLLGNPVAYQNAQTLYFQGPNVTFPMIALLNVVQWMPDYSADFDTDFFTIYAPEYLQWQATLELNKLLRRYAIKQEGNIDEASIQQEADKALATLIEWDNDITAGTSEYVAPPAPPAPQASA